jgi:hypothetical protein
VPYLSLGTLKPPSAGGGYLLLRFLPLFSLLTGNQDHIPMLPHGALGFSFRLTTARIFLGHQIGLLRRPILHSKCAALKAVGLNQVHGT